MAKGLFDHINAITKDQDPKYWDKWYEVSTKEASEYLDILYESVSGREEIKRIAEAYGTEPKLITKLKLKV